MAEQTDKTTETTDENQAPHEHQHNPFNSMEPEMIHEQLRQLQAYDEHLEKQIGELRNSMKYVEEISGLQEGTEILVPITSGIFIKATSLKATEKPFMVNVGSGVVVEKNLDEVNQLLMSHSEEMLDLKQRLTADVLKLQKRMGILRQMHSQGLLQSGNDEPEHVHGPHCNHNH